MPDLYSTPSKYLEYKFLSKSDEVLITRPVCPNADSRYQILIYQCQVHPRRF